MVTAGLGHGHCPSDIYILSPPPYPPPPLPPAHTSQLDAPPAPYSPAISSDENDQSDSEVSPPLLYTTPSFITIESKPHPPSKQAGQEGTEGKRCLQRTTARHSEVQLQHVYTSTSNTSTSNTNKYMLICTDHVWFVFVIQLLSCHITASVTIAASVTLAVAVTIAASVTIAVAVTIYQMVADFTFTQYPQDVMWMAQCILYRW